jgi:hypothetical protein
MINSIVQRNFFFSETQKFSLYSHYCNQHTIRPIESAIISLKRMICGLLFDHGEKPFLNFTQTVLRKRERPSPSSVQQSSLLIYTKVVREVSSMSTTVTFVKKQTHRLFGTTKVYSDMK